MATSPYGHPKGVTDGNGDWSIPDPPTGADEIGVTDEAGDITATDVEGALEELAALKVRKHVVVVGYADITAGGTSKTLNLGAALPDKSQIIGKNVKLTTPFSGGTTSALTVDVGTSGDADAIIDGANLFAAAVDGVASSVPAGIAPNKYFATGPQLAGVFVGVGDNLSNLSAGSVTFEFLYVVFP